MAAKKRKERKKIDQVTLSFEFLRLLRFFAAKNSPLECVIMTDRSVEY